MKFIILFALISASISANALFINNTSSANGKILGPGVAGLGSTMSAPFLAAVSHPTVGFLCSGVIVSTTWILTTAECVYAYSFENPVQVYVDVGGVQIGVPAPGAMTYTLKKIVIHEEFHSRDMIYYNNLALMETSFVMFVNAYMAPIALAANPITAGTVGTLVGWGGTSNSIHSINADISTSNSVLSIAQCQLISGMVLFQELCTDPTISASACKYDHGSPLFEYDPILGSVLMGIVNYAPCFTMYPTIYTSIPDYLDWITNTIK